MLSSETPRCTRSRRRFGPNASRSLIDEDRIARTLPERIIRPAGRIPVKTSWRVSFLNGGITISSVPGFEYQTSACHRAFGLGHFARLDGGHAQAAPLQSFER